MFRYPGETLSDFKKSIRIAKNFTYPMFLEYRPNKETLSYKHMENSNYYNEELYQYKKKLITRYININKLSNWEYIEDGGL
jgi:hypothetical protein